MNHIASAFAMAVLLYLGYIAVAPTPINTLDRICSPAFQWPKRFLAAGARIFSPTAEDKINEAFDNGFGRCRAWGWGVLYEDGYQALMKEEAEKAAGAVEKAVGSGKE